MNDDARTRHLAVATVPVDDDIWPTEAPSEEGAPDQATLAEYAVLGSAVQSSDAAADALSRLIPEQFGGNASRVVFEAIQHLSDEGQPVEPMTVMTELAKAGRLANISAPGMGSGAAFLHSLIQYAGSIPFHAPVIIAAHQQRNVQAVLLSAMDVARNRGFDPDVHLDQIRQMVEDATAFAGLNPLRPNSETVVEVLDSLQHDLDPGLSTGYPDLDDAIGGLRPGELLVVGARPGGGKSLIGLCMADHVGTHLDLPVLFASLEMTEEELTQRRMAAAAQVPLHHLVRHQVTDEDWDRINRTQGRLTETQLHIDDTSQASMAHIRGRLRAMARTGSAARLLVIDYLGFMATPKAESRQQAVAELARGAKNLAREFGIPVVLLAQLNRGPESRSDKRPLASDLRESGEIEQSADIVILLHRDDMHEPDSPRAGEVDLVIQKNRQGPMCTVTLCFQGHYGRIVSLGRDWSPSSNLG